MKTQTRFTGQRVPDYKLSDVMKCPFCGDQPYLASEGFNALHDMTFIKCTFLKCNAKPRVMVFHEIADDEARLAAVEEAIGRWNTRHG